MRLFGHNFLRSNYRKGDPVRLTANALQTNRVADVLKNWEGLGCRITKEGTDWLTVVDGSSDLPLPDGFVLPWTTALASISGGGRIGTSGDGYISFASGTLDHETNTTILDADVANDKITVKVSGIYRVILHARIQMLLDNAGGAASVQSIVAAVYLDGVTTSCKRQLFSDSVRAGDSSDAILEMESSSVIDMEIDASAAAVDAKVYVDFDTALTVQDQVTNCRFAMQYLTSAPE